MNIIRDIQRLSDFKRDPLKFIEQVQETKEPLVLTVNGRAAIVVHDVGVFDEIVAGIERTANAKLNE